jgi:peptidyl-prolyl cis-trans isomerase A (cyclophilin A)
MTGLHHVDGVLSLVRWSPGSGASEFFIVIGESPEFDFGGAYGEGFAVFGRVISGMDVVRKINESPTGNVLPIDYLKDEALLKPVPMRIRRIP